MKASELQVGDIIKRYTNFGGRTYTNIITRVGFISTFGHKSFASGIYQAKGYEYSSDGVKYISEVKKGDILDSDYCEVKRNGKVIN